LNAGGARGPMKPYLCYVHRPDRRLADLAVLTCREDAELPDALDAVLQDWPAHTRVDVYDGQRRVLSRYGSPARSRGAPARGGHSLAAAAREMRLRVV
jgi:hypothetical protein